MRLNARFSSGTSLKACPLDPQKIGGVRSRASRLTTTLLLCGMILSGNLVVAPAIAYWHSQQAVTVTASSGAPTIVQVSCTDVYVTTVGAIPGGVQLTWNRDLNATGYQLLATWIERTGVATYTWTPRTRVYATYDNLGSSSTMSQYVHAGAAVALAYPATGPTIKRVFNADGFDATRAINSSMIFQVVALYGDEWKSHADSIASFPNTSSLEAKPIGLRTSTSYRKLVEFNSDVFRDYMECRPIG